MVKELQPKTDLIILLSHLSYQKDVELAQTVQGIHLIVGSHTGMNLVNPTVIKNTIILQTPPRGMYAGRLDLTLINGESGFYNIATLKNMETNLNNLNKLLNAPQLSQVEKAQLQKSKDRMEQDLKQFQGKNGFTNTIFPLSVSMKDHPQILKMIDEYKSKYPDTPKPITPK